MNQMMIVGVLNEGLGRCLDAGASEKEVRCASEWLRSLMRRDWDVRVLDALATTGSNTDSRGLLPLDYGNGCFEVWWCGEGYIGPTPDAARHAAALAVFPTLSEAVRAELGECL